MKNPKMSLLIFVTCIALAFTVGLFIGRNSIAGELSLSFPEEMRQFPTATDEQSVNGPAPSNTALDINSASYEELMQLPGIGEGLALEIISYRAAEGGFAYVEELLNVPGIGESRLESLIGQITVGGNP